MKELVRSLHGLADNADISRSQMTSIRRLYLEAMPYYKTFHFAYNYKALEGLIWALKASRHTRWVLPSFVVLSITQVMTQQGSFLLATNVLKNHLIINSLRGSTPPKLEN